MAGTYSNKTLFLTVALFVAFVYYAQPTGASEPYEARLEGYELHFNDKDGDKYQKQYAQTLLRRAGRYKFTKNYEDALSDTLSALYFLDEKSDTYKKTLKKLDELFVLNNIDQTEENNFNLARTLFLQKKYYAASWLFSTAIMQKHEEELAYEYMGDIFSEQSNSKAAEQYYLKALNFNRNNAQLKMKLAALYEKTGQIGLATEQYRQILEFTTDRQIVDKIITIFTRKVNVNPDNNNQEILGTAYSKIQKYEETYFLYKKALEQKPDDVYVKYNLAMLLHEMGQSEKAIEIYNSILDFDIYESQIRIGKAKCLEKLGRLNEAIKEYQTVLIFYPESEQAKYGIYRLLKGQIPTENILASFFPLNENFRPDSNFVANFAGVLVDVKQPQDAQNMYRLAISLNPKNKQAHIQLYNSYELEGKSQSAFDVIKKASTIFPNDPEILELYSMSNAGDFSKKVSIAQGYQKNKEYQKAIDSYSQIEPKTSSIYFGIASCYQSLKNQQKTIEYYKKGLSVDPKNIEGLHRLAMIYFDANDYDNATIYLNKMLQVNEGNIGAKRLLAAIEEKQVTVVLNSAYDYFENKNYAKAGEILTNGLKQFPNNAQLLYYRALNFEAQSDLKNAIVDLKNSIKVNPNFDLAYFSLAQILERAGSKKDALAAYERFLGSDSKDKDLIKQAQERVEALTGEIY